MLLALVIGFAAGILIGTGRPMVIDAMRLIGGLWLDALRMTIVPLVFALVVTGVADLATADDGPARRIGARLPIVLAGFLTLSAVVAALLVPPLLALFPLSAGTVAGLRANFPASAPLAIPSTAEAISAMVPVNVVASAAAGAIVPLVVFALVLGLALGRGGADAGGGDARAVPRPGRRDDRRGQGGGHRSPRGRPAGRPPYPSGLRLRAGRLLQPRQGRLHRGLLHLGQDRLRGATYQQSRCRNSPGSPRRPSSPTTASLVDEGLTVAATYRSLCVFVRRAPNGYSNGSPAADPDGGVEHYPSSACFVLVGG